MKLLVVEDDLRMAGLLRRGLTGQGATVFTSATASQAQDVLLSEALDVVICDVMLPDMSGMQLCRWMRSQQIWVPVLLLTARSAIRDRVEGLDAGADDYLTKPFAFDELHARVRALLRRGPTERAPALDVGDLHLDPARREITAAGATLSLSRKEYDLLHLFLRHPAHTLTRTEILEHVWDYNYDASSNVVDVYIGYLRRKLRDAGSATSLATVRGHGYRLTPP